MVFKRQEGFRFEFSTPIEANFIVLANGKVHDSSVGKQTCKVLDISPRGMKIITSFNLNNYTGDKVQLEVYFYLDEIEIKALADVVWVKPFGANFQYGLIFDKQPIVEELIIEELKIRRRKEISKTKSKKV